MIYTNRGAVAVGYGRITINDVDFSEREQEWREPAAKHDHFHIPATNWRSTTIGELIDHDIGCTRKSGWMGRIAESELAFFVYNNVRGVKLDSQCEVGAAGRRKCLRVNGTEYRQLNGKLFERAL